MFLRIVLVSIFLTAPALLSQDKPAQTMLPPTVPEEAAIIPVKTLTGDSFNRLAQMLAVFNVRYRADDKLRTILVYGPPHIVAQVKKVVEELDRPGSEAAIGRNIEMTLTFLRCSTKPQTGPSDVPADLEGAVKQLRAVTQYKSIELWDVIPMRIQEGKMSDQSLRLPGSLPDVPAAMTQAQIQVLPEAVARKDSGRYVRFERLRINLKVPYLSNPKAPPGSLVSSQFSYMDVGINTSGEFKEGQKTVLGKLSGSEDESATFVVVSLKVLD